MRKARTFRVNGKRVGTKPGRENPTYTQVLNNESLTKRYYSLYKQKFAAKQSEITNKGYNMAIAEQADLGDFEWYIAARGNDLTAKYKKEPSIKSVITDMVNQQAYTKSWKQSASIFQAATRQGIAVDFNDILYGETDPYELEKERRINELVSQGLDYEEASHFAIASLAAEWFNSN